MSQLFELYLIAPLSIDRPTQCDRKHKSTRAPVDLDRAKLVHVAGLEGESATNQALKFAVPAEISVSEEHLDRPGTVAFCLTDSRGQHKFGCSMVLVQDCGHLQLSGVFVVSCWPLVEVYQGLLHSLYACRSEYGLDPFNDTPCELLVNFVQGARTTLSSFASELKFVDEHALWCGIDIQLLFKRLRWDAFETLFLMLSLMTDQRVLLHSSRRETLYVAVTALKSLMAPLKVAGIFIPYLPSSLLLQSDADILLNEATQPYLIGCESALLEKLPRISPELVLVNLDTGSVWHPDHLPEAMSRTSLMRTRAVVEFCNKLQDGMGDCTRFRPLHVRTSCLGFTLGFCDVYRGSFACTASNTLRDTVLAETLSVLGRYSADLSARFKSSTNDSESCSCMQDSVRAAEASLLPGLASSLMKSNATSSDVAPLLELVWKSMPFNVWWQSRPEADVVSHLMQHRADGPVLLEYVKEHLHSLSLVEQKVQDALQAIFVKQVSA